MNNKKKLGLIIACLGSLVALPVYAGPFEIAVSPSRLELNANTSQRLGQSLEIQNLGKAPTELTLRTLDWTYSNEGQITYHEALLPNSCRPWVTLEKSSLKLNAQAKRSFRFQVQVPANTPRTECRFMVAIEGKEAAANTTLKLAGASLSLPVNGRIAVAVYIAVGGAEPKLSIKQLNVHNAKGQRVPVVTSAFTVLILRTAVTARFKKVQRQGLMRLSVFYRLNYPLAWGRTRTCNTRISHVIPSAFVA